MILLCLPFMTQTYLTISLKYEESLGLRYIFRKKLEFQVSKEKKTEISRPVHLYSVIPINSVMQFIFSDHDQCNIDFQTLTAVNTKITHINLGSCGSQVYPSGQDFKRR